VAKVTLTAYSSTIAQCDSTPWETATLKRPRRGYVALSRDLIATYTPGAPFRYGDQVEIVGLGIFQVEDTMNPRWQRRADVWMPSTEEAIQFGRQTVLLARLGDRTMGAAKGLDVAADLGSRDGERARSKDL
jgi:3D (Asp-Asp-Asp) domain-containing protein